MPMDVNCAEMIRTLADRVGLFKGQKICIVGDAMLDHYIVGGVERISPEAPVPVVRVDSEYHRLGGAGNVARNIAALGGRPLLIGCRGLDPDGDRLSSLLDECGVENLLVQDPDRPTTRKTRIVAQNQQIVRVDWENGGVLAGEAAAGLLDCVRTRAADYPVIILSDYGKGVISRAFMEGFWAIFPDPAHRPLVLVDPKPGNAACYAHTDLLTPNTKEAGECAGTPIRSREDVPAVGRIIMENLGLPHLLVTLGREGMALFESPDIIWHIPTTARKVFDVTGAGDTVIATLGLSLAAGVGLLHACILANYAAGVVVGEVGAATVSAEELAVAVRTQPCPLVARL